MEIKIWIIYGSVCLILLIGVVVIIWLIRKKFRLKLKERANLIDN